MSAADTGDPSSQGPQCPSAIPSPPRLDYSKVCVGSMELCVPGLESGVGFQPRLDVPGLSGSVTSAGRAPRLPIPQGSDPELVCPSDVRP